MTPFVRSLRAEILKLRRTLALWMAFVTPLAIVGLIFVGTLLQHGRASAAGKAWDWFPRIIFSLWGLLMLPLFITLETALLGELESTEKHWKHLFALPVPRSAFYVAKLLVGAGLIGVGTSVLWCGILLAGVTLRWLKPGLGFDAPFPGMATAQTALLLFLASWLILALHTWVSLRWRNFMFSVGLGMIATVINAFLTNSEKYARFYPWALPSMVISGDPNALPQVLALGVLGGIALAAAGCWDMIRQDVL